MPDATTTSPLSEKQLARAEALKLARAVLVARGPFSVAEGNALDMHALACFILDGGDPWATAPESVSA